MDYDNIFFFKAQGPKPDVLQFVELELLDQTSCDQFFPFNEFGVDGEEICAYEKVGILFFKANFRSDGRKMQKSCTLKTFNRIFKDFLRVETLAIAGYTKKLSSFALSSFSSIYNLRNTNPNFSN